MVQRIVPLTAQPPNLAVSNRATVNGINIAEDGAIPVVQSQNGVMRYPAPRRGKAVLTQTAAPAMNPAACWFPGSRRGGKREHGSHPGKPWLPPQL